MTLRSSLVIAAVAALAGCSEPAKTLDWTDGEARSACVKAVAAQTGNPEVYAARSAVVDGGTEVILQVGATGTWRCIAARDGTTSGITSLTDEGTL